MYSFSGDSNYSELEQLKSELEQLKSELNQEKEFLERAKKKLSDKEINISDWSEKEKKGLSETSRGHRYALIAA